MLHGSDSAHELIRILIVVQREERWQLVDQSFIELTLEVPDGLQQFVHFSSLSVLLRHWHEHVNDWDEHVEFQVVLHILQVQLFEVLHENQSHCIVVVVNLIVSEVLVDRGQNF